ncbi:GNAT family N-acetyltransferase [Hoeflea sp. YIM 152468]|uniref:GNAT family N-acetyltransferase n=1 Tax=Hoeflea sp. YIM 152468 TaxID=3031759 RepID=UPI0023D9CB07|nr:GNAT family N-acetyltransferase [Hoeflea sp. YIM 152468]MDF1609290.1 GNAT family N-acetyltransferase [Hoeflea sp. YIM 152468]
MKSHEITIRPAVAADAAGLNRALAQLSADMGDEHGASDADIARFCFGPAPVMHALLAETADRAIVGVAAYSPFVSTVYGSVGVYISDLWVADEARGNRLGLALLAAVRAAGLEVWNASFLRLNVYHDNPRALAFYERLGFVPTTETQYMTLVGTAYDALGAQP